MSANDYKPFPRTMDHHLRTLAEQINKEDNDVSNTVYLIRKTIAEVYAAGHQEGFVVGLEHSTMVRAAEREIRG
jgi:hypothetical protein